MISINENARQSFEQAYGSAASTVTPLQWFEELFILLADTIILIGIWRWKRLAVYAYFALIPIAIIFILLIGGKLWGSNLFEFYGLLKALLLAWAVKRKWYLFK